MFHPQNAYRKLKPEIRFMCRFLADDSFQDEALFLQVKPDVLLEVLRQHKLYPPFYSKWVQSAWKDLREWNDFTVKLKILVERNRLQMMRKTAVLVKVIQAFERDNIQALAFKGPVQSIIIFGDVAVKASIDLDILIDEIQFDDAVNALKKTGFTQMYLKKDLNRHQKSYLLQHFHHLRFFHPEEKLMLELHWQLNTNKYLLDYSFGQLLDEATILKVGEQDIKTLSGKNLIEQLATHGAQHSWARLDWLYEFSVALTKYQSEFAEIEEEFKRQELNLLLDFSLRLSNEIFRTGFPLSDQERSRQHSMIRYYMEAMQNPKVPDYTRPLERIRNKFYQSGFKKGFRYKSQVWFATRTNIIDWATMPLPKSLFFLYYFLRPAMMVMNVFRKNRNL